MAGSSETQPRVSICVPAYQAGDYLEATVQSVIAQTMSAWELVVYDNGSTDQTQQILKSFVSDPRIRVVSASDTLPMAESWNRAAKQAEAPYVKLLCADDVLHPQCLEAELHVFDRNPDVAVVATRRDFIDASGAVVVKSRGLAGLLGTHNRSTVIHRVARSGMNPIGWPSAMMYRRKDFETVGGFDSEFPAVMDLDLAIRLLACGSFHGIDRSLAFFRVTGSSASATLKHQGEQYRLWLRRLGQTTEGLSRWSLARGRMLSYGEQIKKRLLFAAVNSRKPLFVKLPSLFLRPSAGAEAEAAAASKEVNRMATKTRAL